MQLDLDVSIRHMEQHFSSHDHWRPLSVVKSVACFYVRDPGREGDRGEERERGGVREREAEGGERGRKGGRERKQRERKRERERRS